MHSRPPFDSGRRPSPRARRSRAAPPLPIPVPPRIPLSAEARLRRAHRHRVRALHELGLEVPDTILNRHPQDLAWRVSVMDRWIARHLDLAGGRRLPPWTDEVDDEAQDDAEDDAHPRGSA